MNLRELAFCGQLVVRILISVLRSILLILHSKVLVPGSRFAPVHVRDAVAAVMAVGGWRRFRIFVIVG